MGILLSLIIIFVLIRTFVAAVLAFHRRKTAEQAATEAAVHRRKIQAYEQALAQRVAAHQAKTTCSQASPDPPSSPQ